MSRHHLPLILACLSTALPGAATAHAQSRPAGGRAATLNPLASVFETQRSEEEDTLYLQDGQVLRGQILTEQLSIITPYGEMAVPLRRCAGISFEKARANAETLVTVNYNRITGIIRERVIRFQAGLSGEATDIRKEKIRFILRAKSLQETDFVDVAAGTILFVMTNGDLLTGRPAEPQLKIRTGDENASVSFSEVENVEVSGDGKLAVVVEGRDGRFTRGILLTEQVTLKLDVGVTVPDVYAGRLSKIVTGSAIRQAAEAFGVDQPVDYGTAGPGAGEIFANSLGMEFVQIKPGEFWMGSPDNEKGRAADESPRHQVRLSKGFYLGRTEVTQRQWIMVMRTRPWSGQDYVRDGADYPAVYVSWNDAREFCRKLSEKEGRTYRLPTEAEWEYACRAGTTTRFSFGDDEEQLGGYAWYDANAKNTGGAHAHRVARKKPNPWGLYDMYGNVYEVCSDWYGDYAAEAVENPSGPGKAEFRALRGGSWFGSGESCRSADRGGVRQGSRLANSGFRVAFDAP